VPIILFFCNPLCFLLTKLIKNINTEQKPAIANVGVDCCMNVFLACNSKSKKFHHAKKSNTINISNPMLSISAVNISKRKLIQRNANS